jgi:hypothetical protein
MKSKFGVAALGGWVIIALSATLALAQCSPPASAPMIKFDADAFAYETAYTPATFTSAAGSQLTVVGIVSLFCNPFTDLNPADPSKEYTFIWDGLVSLGTVTSTLSGGRTRYTTEYTTGVFRIYEGSPRNAPTAATPLPALPPVAGVVPDAFVDGTVILSGIMTGNLVVTLTKTSTGTFTSSFRANYQCTGGTLFSRVDNSINLMDGAWVPVPATNPDPPAPLGTSLLPAGWSAHPNGKWDPPQIVSARPSTWGKIKTLYR